MLVILKAMFSFVSLNMLVIFLIFGPKYVNVVHWWLLSCLVILVFCWLSILVLSLCISWVGKLLLWAIVCIFDHSLFWLDCVRGSENNSIN